MTTSNTSSKTCDVAQAVCTCTAQPCDDAFHVHARTQALACSTRDIASVVVPDVKETATTAVAMVRTLALSPNGSPSALSGVLVCKFIAM